MVVRRDVERGRRQLVDDDPAHVVGDGDEPVLEVDRLPALRLAGVVAEDEVVGQRVPDRQHALRRAGAVSSRLDLERE